MRAARSCPLPALLMALGALVTALPAAAHVGNVPAKAVFYLPPPPVQVPGGDGGMRWSFTPAEADTHYLLAWQDGDNDPTGRFAFYYVDHAVPVAAPPDFIDGRDANGSLIGQPIGPLVMEVGGRAASEVYVGCACARQDAAAVSLDGSVPPNCFDGGARWCDNAIDWDTSAVPDGVYWIYAVNTDPPFHVYNLSEAPVRVSHGAKRPPMVLVVRPGGSGPSADASYRLGLLVDGQEPLTLDLAWGINETELWRMPLHRFASALPATRGPDGTVAYDWDTRALPTGAYYISASITDAGGAFTYTNSRYGMSVNHRGDMGHGGLSDLGASPGDAPLAADGAGMTGGKDGCGCVVGGARDRSSPTAMMLLVAGAVAAMVRRWRRGRRTANRC